VEGVKNSDSGLNLGFDTLQGTGPAWWLDARDAARAASNDPKLLARQAEEDRQARIARLGYDPCVPGEAAAHLARRI
jgi:hypothetical protein